MARESLRLDFDFEGLLFVIASQEAEHRLCWGLNRSFGLQLERKDDFLAPVEKNHQHPFPVFECYEEEHFRFWRLLSNKDQNQVLLRDFSAFNYLLIMSGEADGSAAERLLEHLREHRFVQMAFLVDPLRIKNPYVLMQS